jgi:2-polyprenyl-3-methyl-5-hydroxy-6-metoxy-1,4-benzoquinol methylase
MPYIIYQKNLQQNQPLGQSWTGEDIRENIKLCDFQPIGNIMSNYLSKEDAILEAGCGMGRWVFYFKAKGFRIAGLEASGDAVQAAKKHDSNANIFVGDVKKTTFDDESFNAIISLGVMEHFIEGPHEVLQETKRLLKQNGYLFVAIPPANIIRKLFTHPLISVVITIKKLMGEHYSFSEYRYTESEFSLHLNKAGFEIVEIVTDELILPRNLGLYVDFPMLRHREIKWRLNKYGFVIAKLMNLISDRLYRGGVLFVCRKS